MDRQEDALLKLGRQLTHLRETRQLTIPELAALTGLEPRDIATMEAGEIDIRITTIFILAGALGVTPDKFLPPF